MDGETYSLFGEAILNINGKRASKQMASIIASIYHGLIEEGISEEAAVALTQTWLFASIQQAAQESTRGEPDNG